MLKNRSGYKHRPRFFYYHVFKYTHRFLKKLSLLGHFSFKYTPYSCLNGYESTHSRFSSSW